MVSKELMQELRTIFQEDYGVSLSDADVLEIANTLVSFFEVLVRVDKS